MFISLLSTNPQVYFAVILAVTISICLHELAHGFAAIALGDRTPEERGHITMNPLVHMGPISLIMLAVVGISWGMMPVDPTRLRGKYAESLVALAGPAVNLVLSLLGATALGLWFRFGTPNMGNHMVENAVVLLEQFAFLNLVLFLFNLIPVPPLDGSRVMANLVPAYRRMTYDPTMQGVFLALTVGALFGAGRILVPWASGIMSAYLRWVIGIG